MGDWKWRGLTPVEWPCRCEEDERPHLHDLVFSRDGMRAVLRFLPDTSTIPSEGAVRPQEASNAEIGSPVTTQAWTRAGADEESGA